MFLNDTSVLSKVSLTNLLKKSDSNSSFNEILEGLTASNKYISSKYFYNSKGSELFEKITYLQEYYPTRTEKGILNDRVKGIFNKLTDVDIIELGSGDCSKISILLKAIPASNLSTISYIPVDVSESALRKSAIELSVKFPALTIEAVVADFLKQFNYLKRQKKKVICFLGSTIGNLAKGQAQAFINEVSAFMQPGDLFLMGTDMVKDINIVEKAYNDEKGVTEAFNLNILSSVNQVLSTDLKENNFEHLAFYNKIDNRIEMHLVVKESFSITVPENGVVIEFKKGEHIHTENSHKFTPETIQKFTQENKLILKDIYSDENEYFSLCAFQR